MNKLTFAFTLLMALTANIANAAMIDDFKGGEMNIAADGSNIYKSYASAFGGGRSVSITKAGFLGASAKVFTVPGIYTHNADALTSATSSITWTEATGVDLTDGLINNYFDLAINSIDQGEINLTFAVTDFFNASSSYTLFGADIGIENIAFSLFSGINFHHVTEISLQIMGGTASDLAIDSLSTSGTVSSPSGLVLLAMGFIAFGFSHRNAAKNNTNH